jgi:hypothetical protein
VLAILFPHVNTRNVHHVDHVFPQALLHANRLKAANFTSDQITDLQDKRDRLPNLQLLEGPENIAKSATDPLSWLVSNYSEEGRGAHLERHALPWLPSSVDQFEEFYEARRKALADRIRKMLGTATLASGEPAQHALVEDAARPVVAD